jgi:hypothetical protein
MTLNTSKVSATVGNARFEAEGPAEIVLSQYTQFLKTVKTPPAPMPETGPQPLGVWVLRRCFTVGVAHKPSTATKPPAVRFIHHFGPVIA